MRAMTWRAVSFVVLAICVTSALSGCGEIPATNPFDPETPADQQHTSRLDLFLTLPLGFDASTFAEPPTAVLTDVVEPDSAQAGRTTPLTVNGAGDGLRLQMGDLRPGDYRLVFSLRPLGHDPLLVHIPLGGGTVTLPGLSLAAPATTPEASGLLMGRVRRSTGGEVGHAGIDVRLGGTPYAARTEDDGAWSLLAPAGVYTVSASTEFHGTEIAPDVRAVAGETTIVADLILSALPGRISADVELQAGLSPALLEELRVSLWSLAEPSGAPFALGNLTGTRELGGRAHGVFALTDVPPGTWEVRATLEGFEGDSVMVEVLPGRLTAAAPLEVRLANLAPGENPPTRVAGRVRLAGVLGEAGHGGTRVELEGTPLVGFTADDGRFELTVPARRAVVHAHRPGYAAATTTLESVPEGVLTSLPEELVLVPLPGGVTGVIQFGRFGGVERLPDVAVRLLDGAGLPVASTVPGPDGAFVMSVPPGEVTLEATTVGFAPARQFVRVTAGEVVPLGMLLLRHLSETDAAVPLTGVVEALGADSQAGTTVRLTFAGRDTLFQSVLTDAQGRFAVFAAADETYLATLERAEYAAVAAIGPLAWDPDDGRFERAGHDSELHFELTPNPFVGHLTAQYSLRPDWVPAEQVRATVAVVGPEGTQVVAGVAPGQAVTIDVSTPGAYLIRITRPGFATAEGLGTLDRAHPTARVEGHLVLENLAEAGLDLGAATLTSAQLTGVRLEGANLAGLTLLGDFAEVPLRGATLINADLRGATLVGVSLARADLRGADLTGVDASGASLEGADLFGAHLAGARLVGARLDGADLSSALLDGARFNGENEPLPGIPCDLGAQRPQVSLEGAHLVGASLVGAFLSGVDLRHTDLTNARLTGAQLDRTCLRGGVLTLTDLTGATLTQADLGGASVVLSVLQDVGLRGADLRGSRLISSVFEGADLGCVERAQDGSCACAETFEDADVGGACASPDTAAEPRCRCRTRLGDANLNGANLAGADLSGADLVRAFGVQVATGDAAGMPAFRPGDCVLPEGCAFDAVHPPACVLAAGRACTLRRTRFVGARLEGAELPGLIFAHADLTGARFGTANLTLAQFTPSTTFRFADFSGAVLTGARLSATDLRGVRFDRAALGSAALDAADARGTSFRGANLDHTDVAGAYLAGADLRETRLRATDLSTAADTDGRPLDLTGADLEGEPIGWLGRRTGDGPAFSAVRLDGAHLRGVSLGPDLNADFTGRSFRGADLTNADLGQIGVAPEDLTLESRFALELVDLTGALLDGARLPAVAVLAVIDGVTLNGAQLETGETWSLRRSSLRDADLGGRVFPGMSWFQTDARGANLGRVSAGGVANLPGTLITRLSRVDDLGAEPGALSSLDARLCDLRRLPWRALLSGDSNLAMDIVGSDLRDVDLTGLRLATQGGAQVNFTDSDLRGVRFDRAQLGMPLEVDLVHFLRADLAGARFNDAQLFEVAFTAVDVRDTDFSGARLDRPLLDNTDLSTARLQVGLQVTAPSGFQAGRFMGLDLTLGDTAPCAFAPLTVARVDNFARADLRCRDVEASFGEANLSDVRLEGSRLATAGGIDGVNLSRARLNGATLPRTVDFGSLREADLTGAMQPVRSVITAVDLTGTRLETAAGHALSLREVDVSTNAATALLRHIVGPGSVFFGGVAPDLAPVGGMNPILSMVAGDDANLSRGRLPTMQFKDSSLARISLRDASLPTPRFDGVIMGEADLGGAAARGAVFHRALGRCAVLDGADFRDASLMGLVTDGCLSAVGTNLEGALFHGPITYSTPVAPAPIVLESREFHADLRGIDLTRARLVEVDLSGLDLRETLLVDALLSGANLSDTVLVDAELAGAQLDGAALDGAQLTGADFAGANLSGASLSGALAGGTDLSSANLAGADLGGAQLWASNLAGADLRRARFAGASFSGANLTGARLCLTARAALPPGSLGAPLFDPEC